MSVETASAGPDRWSLVARRAAARDAAGLGAAHAALAELHAAFARQLAAWLSARVAGGDLDEVHQEIWLRVWEKLPGHFQGGNFRAWLFAIARNHLVDAARRRGIRRDLGYGGAAEEPDAAPPDPDGEEPWEILVAEERGRRLRGCLDRLDAGRRRVIVGRIGGEDYDAIAAALEISTAQAQSWLFVAKKLLRECLGEGER
ncbi:MAG: RNA polymerase sigma factor [Planctomycetaceae bacterium]